MSGMVPRTPACFHVHSEARGTEQGWPAQPLASVEALSAANLLEARRSCLSLPTFRTLKGPKLTFFCFIFIFIFIFIIFFFFFFFVFFFFFFFFVFFSFFVSFILFFIFLFLIFLFFLLLLSVVFCRLPCASTS